VRRDLELLRYEERPADLKGVWGFGDMWTWTALCADTKLVPSWMVAGRDSGAALAFMEDLAGRLV